MTTAELPFAVDRAAIARFCQERGIRRLSLFGSILRPDFDPIRSDVDVLVELRPEVSPASVSFLIPRNSQRSWAGRSTLTRRRCSVPSSAPRWSATRYRCMSKHDPAVTLRQLLAHAGRVHELATTTTLDALLLDWKLTSAFEREMEILGEAVKRLPPDLTARYPSIPWTFGLFFRDGEFQGKFTVPATLNKGGHAHDYQREIHPNTVVYLQRIVDRAQESRAYHANYPIFSGRHADEAACYATARRHLLAIFDTVFGTTYRLGAHSLRKAGAHLVYQSKGLLAANAFLLHASLNTTCIYLMLEDDEINAGVIGEFDEIYEAAKTQHVTLREKKPAQLVLSGTEEEAAPRPPKMSWEAAPVEVDADEAYFAAARKRCSRARTGTKRVPHGAVCGFNGR